MTAEYGDGYSGLTVDESTESWPQEHRPPADAPNVVLVLLDDAGFGHLGCYGSAIETPAIDRLATGGLRYTSFHTTALCSPSRACVMTGRNHHSVGLGMLATRTTGFRGYHGRIPRSNGFLSEVLRERGYATYAVGKWHLTPTEETSAAGPYTRWPLGRGFDRFYGFLSGENNQWYPRLVHDNHRVPAPERDDYHFTEDITDRATEFIRELRNVDADKPFFLYYCPGAVHAPHHVPAEYIDRYRGRFDHGWDVERERTLERQQATGVMPETVSLPPRSPGVAAWDELPEEHRRLYARMQEVFAAFLTHTDDQIGRLVTLLEELGELDNTVFVVASDNGASSEGGEHGLVNEIRYFNRFAGSFDDAHEHLDELGGPETYNHFPAGWAMVGNTPFKLFKRWVFEGGVADPLVVHWPRGISGSDGICRQYHHAIDLMPTILEAARIPMPDTVAAVPQRPLEGTSMAYTFTEPAAPTCKRTQYYEMAGHRGLWHEGWKIVSTHTPGSATGQFDGDDWELYHTDEDPNELHDLALRYPDKVRELVNRWWVEAGKYNVLPLDDRTLTRTSTAPKPGGDRTRTTYYPSASDIPQVASADVRNRSHRITACVEIPPEGAEGVLLAQGGRFGGYALFVQEGHLVYVHNMLGYEEYQGVSDHAVPTGKPVDLEFRFTSTGEHQGRGELVIAGRAAGLFDVPRTVPIRYDNDGALNIGRDLSLGVSRRYRPPFAFTGVLRKVDVDLAVPTSHE